MNTWLSGAERALAIQWIAATVVGWIVGFAACEALKTFVTTVFVDGLVIGTFVGGAQWLVVRGRIRSAGWWIVASIIGFGLGKAVGDALLPAAGTPLGDALAGALIGVSVGVAQWLILRRQLDAAWWWIPTNTLAWLVGWTVIAAAERSVEIPTPLLYVVGAVGAAMAGLITAAALIWLSRQRTASAA